MKVKDTRIFEGNKVIADLEGNKVVPRKGYEDRKGEIVAFLNAGAAPDGENPPNESSETPPVEEDKAAEEAKKAEEAEALKKAEEEKAEREAAEAAKKAEEEAEHGEAARKAADEAAKKAAGEKKKEERPVDTSVPPPSPFAKSPTDGHPYAIGAKDKDKIPFGLQLKKGIPKPPKLDPTKGTKTPEFMHWMAKYYPEEFKEKYHNYYVRQEAMKTAAKRKAEQAAAKAKKFA